MKGRLHTMLALRSMIYAMINLLPSGVALLVMPFITMKMTPTEYGVSGLYLAIIAGMLSAIEFSLIVRKAYVHHEQGEALSEALSACGAIYTLLIAGLILVAMAAWPLLASFVPLSRGWVLLALVTAGMQSVISLNLSLMQISLRVKLFCTMKLLFTFSYPAVALLCLFVLDMGWQSLAYASLCATVATVLVSGWRLKLAFGLHWVLGRERFVRTFQTILSLTPFRLALAIFTYAGPFLVAYAADTEQSGLYIFAFQICNVIGLVYDSILTAIVPHMVAHHKISKVDALDVATRRRLASGYILVVIIASLALALLSPLVVGLLFPESYQPALPFIGWIAVARCFHGINRINQELSFFDMDSFRRIAGVSLGAALAYVVVTLTLLRIYGPLGAGMGLAAGHGLWLVALVVAKPWLVRKRS